MLNEKDFAKKAKESAMLSNLITQIILSDEDAPEYIKLQISIMDALLKLDDTFLKHIEKYIRPGSDCTDIKLLTSILEYIKLVEAGINRFFDETEGVKE